jgi:serine protease Do
MTAPSLTRKLIGSDPRTDLAVLKVEEEREFTYVAFADDKQVRVGDWVVAVGNPFGLGGTVTAGIVSARGRDIGAGPYDDFIQIDAAVNRGNSGGPTFNLNGEVVGVNTAIFSPSGGNVGIAFAVPASTAKDVVAELMDDGNVERGWLGVSHPAGHVGYRRIHGPGRSVKARLSPIRRKMRPRRRPASAQATSSPRCQRQRSQGAA